MITRMMTIVVAAVALATVNGGPLLAQHAHSLAQRIAQTDRAKMAHVERRHDGAAGGMDVMTLVDGDQMQSNLLYMFRGEIPPKGGIGHHYHTRVEEMFVIFDGDVLNYRGVRFRQPSEPRLDGLRPCGGIEGGQTRMDHEEGLIPEPNGHIRPRRGGTGVEARSEEQ